ncbi:MAG: dephospho-CoA kinase, partial [Sedimenticola sp.]
MQQQLSELTAPYAIFSIPLLVESRQKHSVDRVLLVDCPKILQIKRIIQRDGIDHDQAVAILKAQSSREERLAVTDDVIDNSGSMAALYNRVEDLHKQYQQMAPHKHR